MFKRLFKRRPKKAKSYVTPPTAPTYTMSRAGGGEADFEVGPVRWHTSPHPLSHPDTLSSAAPWTSALLLVETVDQISLL